MGAIPRHLTTPSSTAGRGAALLVAAALAACATAPPPVDQVRYFSQAFGTVNTVGQPLLDDLAIAERSQGRQIAARRAEGRSAAPGGCPASEVPWQRVAGDAKGFINGFCLPDAPYFSDLGDPPATRQLRGGLAVIEQYASVLSILTEGRKVQAAIGEVDALGKQVSGLLGAIGVASPVGAALAAVQEALQPVLKIVADQANAAEARRLILAGAPEVTRLIEALRQAAPAMFSVLTEASARQATLQEQPAAVAGEVQRIDAYRVAVANYVFLLGKLQTSWDLTVAAANRPPGEGRVSALIEQTTALRTDAEAARRVFAVLRAGGPVPVK